VLYTGEVLSNSASGLLGFDAFPARDYRALMAAAPQTFLPDTPNQVPFTGPFSTANDPNAALPMDVNNSFYVKEKTTAFYVQAKGEGDIGGLEYKGNAGVRAVKTDDKAIGFQGVRVIDQATNRQISSVTTAATAQNDYWTYLPSANVSLFLRPDVTLRSAWPGPWRGRSSSGLAPIAAITKADPTQPLYNPSLADTARIGNANLKPQTSWNYDATVEYYPGNGGAYYASLYYKDVKDFVFTGTFRNQTLPARASGLRRHDRRQPGERHGQRVRGGREPALHLPVRHLAELRHPGELYLRRQRVRHHEPAAAVRLPGLVEAQRQRNGLL
jgi:outer membrane receptor protein involved in Fe transport